MESSCLEAAEQGGCRIINEKWSVDENLFCSRMCIIYDGAGIVARSIFLCLLHHCFFINQIAALGYLAHIWIHLNGWRVILHVPCRGHCLQGNSNNPDPPLCCPYNLVGHIEKVVRWWGVITEEKSQVTSTNWSSRGRISSLRLVTCSPYISVARVTYKGERTEDQCIQAH